MSEMANDNYCNLPRKAKEPRGLVAMANPGPPAPMG
jgi:hypothetical protein